MSASPQDTDSDVPRHRGWWAVAGGWFGFFLLWTLFILGWAQGNVPIRGAVVSALLATLPGALLGLPVWWLAGKMEWPPVGVIRFAGVHLAALFGFATLWTFTGPALGVLIEGGSLAEMRWETQTYVWRLFMGVLLYVIVAGLSYAAHISRRLRRQEQIASRAEAFAAKANLAAMRSQLRPHFLFNALHSISSLIDTDPERASDAMELLGDLLRYTIRERDDDVVSLEEEWQFVSDYIELQRLRFGDRVAVAMEPLSDSGAVRVPPFVLQPLVENAFVHGMDSRSSGGTVSIRANKEGSSLVLVVEDNGHAWAAVGPNGTSVAGGTGLGNLRRRLMSLYGDGALLTVESLPAGGTRARIELPIVP